MCDDLDVFGFDLAAGAEGQVVTPARIGRRSRQIRSKKMLEEGVIENGRIVFEIRSNTRIIEGVRNRRNARVYWATRRRKTDGFLKLGRNSARRNLRMRAWRQGWTFRN